VATARHFVGGAIEVRDEGTELGKVGHAPDGALILVDEDHHAAAGHRR
jgi:hypothetical protein